MNAIRSIFSVLLVSFLLTATDARAEAVLGQPAPPIKSAKWLKGEPVIQFEKGHVYVVEFWTTWCAPCHASVPYVSNLADKYAGKATVIAVNSCETLGLPPPRDGKKVDVGAKVERFVRKHSDQMRYRVAMDDPRTEPVHKAWGRLAESLSMSAIIDRDGIIVWTGPARELARPLAQVVAGTYDVRAEIASRAKQTLIRERHEKLAREIKTAGANEEYAKVVELSDALIRKHADIEPFLFIDRLDALMNVDRKKGVAYALAKQAALTGKDERWANEYAVAVVASMSPGLHDGGLSKEAYELFARCVRYQIDSDARNEIGVTPLSYGVLAHAYFRAGQVAKAVEMQKLAIDLAAKNPMLGDLSRLKGELEEYRRGPKEVSST